MYCLTFLIHLNAMELLRAGNDYEKFFDARSYVRSRFTAKDGVVSDEEYQTFNLCCYHEFYRKYGSDLDVESARVLEFGGGPCIFPLISAASHVKEIVFSEYLESCREEVKLWKDKNPESHNWTPYFR